MTDTAVLDDDAMHAWADDTRGAVALHLRQVMLPVEGACAVVFPPTYAGEGNKPGGYNIDVLADGTRVVTLDSVGSQANRMEPMFKAAPDGRPTNHLAALVPQIDIKVETGPGGEGEGAAVSIFDVGHRLGDALVRSSSLHENARAAFTQFRDKADATRLAKLAPTSLVFGVWDSRDTSAKLPRIVQAVIRGWNVSELTRSAQYEPPLDYAGHEVFSEADKAKAEGKPGSPLAQRGFVHVPATRVPGGVVVNGQIVRDVTVNLVALRRLDGAEGTKLRRYILGLALAAATEPPEAFLRAGCLLTLDPDTPATWRQVDRSGARTVLELTPELAQQYVKTAAKEFGVGARRDAEFEKDRARKDAAEAKPKGKPKVGENPEGSPGGA